MPRMYEKAWIELKKSEETPKRIVISAHSKLHPRIYKAIRKEKDMDVVYKLQLCENAQSAILRSKSEGGRLTIMMKLSLGLSDF